MLEFKPNNAVVFDLRALSVRAASSGAAKFYSSPVSADLTATLCRA
jgi:hypothetical protein